jgi:hypothetical protein
MIHKISISITGDSQASKTTEYGELNGKYSIRKNKALVLEAFDTLFNKRDYVSFEGRPGSFSFKEVGLTDNNVIEHVDLQNPCLLAQPASQPDISFIKAPCSRP